MNDILVTIILGIVEGITEFVPVSSTGHLIALRNLLDFHPPGAESFTIFIQVGAICAIFFFYKERFIKLLDFSDPAPLSGFRGMGLIVLGCIPAGLAGFFLHGIISEYFLGADRQAVMLVAAALITGGVAMFLIEPWYEKREHLRMPLEASLTYSKALLIGCFQTLALWSGMSRSGSTIMGGMLMGLKRRDAAEFSFLLAAPIMFGATALDLYKNFDVLAEFSFTIFAVGFVTAFFSGLLAIRFLLGYLAKHSLRAFGVYRIALGLLLIFSVR